ncbi:helix-turn-helix domain-containing protein [Specibacter cremeus]|uniref:helix-turn-helix domain-containing protein n=1 Tax=Specibacter cremeus TaxID=1629051 RepID=UPI000F776E8F|nr:helix-turn-helix domain-containing protein [Specibacter cremeus]
METKRQMGKNQRAAKRHKATKEAKTREAEIAMSAKNRDKAPIRLLEQVWTGASEESKETFIAIVSESAYDGLDVDLWGEPPSPQERKSVALEQIALEFSRRETVLDKSLTASEAAGLLHVSVQAVRDRIESGDLIGLRDGRQWRLPVWQFNAEAERGFIPGIARVRAVFPAVLCP